MKPRPSKTEVLHVVEQAMRIRMVWEEVSSTHWARPLKEVEEALKQAAARWDVPIDDTFAARAALVIYADSWE
ncbi:hypothetical protein [Streptomyces sp. DH8]|uniref:hypothetical protein n=1 Tax=Streptomyces sp. DH8 TaxID=2857008 RepID=UPI001E4DDAE0|nr:hypothetical protein [Streptomyces sp. DH8]